MLRLSILIDIYYVPHLTEGSPVNPLAHAQNGFPVSYTTSQTAFDPLQMILSHGSRAA